MTEPLVEFGGGEVEPVDLNVSRGALSGGEVFIGGELYDSWSNEASIDLDERRVDPNEDEIVDVETISDHNGPPETLNNDPNGAEVALPSPKKRFKAKEDESDEAAPTFRAAASFPLSPFQCAQCRSKFTLEELGTPSGGLPLYGDVKARLICGPCHAPPPSAFSLQSTSSPQAIFKYPFKRPWIEIAFVALVNLAIQVDGDPSPVDGTYHRLFSNVYDFIYDHFDTLCYGYSRNCWKSHVASALTTLPSHFEHAEGQQGKGSWRLVRGAAYPTTLDAITKQQLTSTPSNRSRSCRNLSIRTDLAPSVPSSVRLARKRTSSEANLTNAYSARPSSTAVSTASLPELEDSSSGLTSRNNSTLTQDSGSTTPRYSTRSTSSSTTVRVSKAQRTSTRSLVSVPPTASFRPQELKAAHIRSKTQTDDKIARPTLAQEWRLIASLGPFANRYVRHCLRVRESATSLEEIRDMRKIAEAALALVEMQSRLPAPPLETLHNVLAAHMPLPGFQRTNFYDPSRNWLQSSQGATPHHDLTLAHPGPSPLTHFIGYHPNLAPSRFSSNIWHQYPITASLRGPVSGVSDASVVPSWGLPSNDFIYLH